MKARGQEHGMYKHGHRPQGGRTPTYNSWSAMRKRCLNPKFHNFNHYGGRGITVCPRWDDFSQFLADMGERPEGTTLDRVDTNGNYEPSNCRWASNKEQAASRSNTKLHTIDDQTESVPFWCALYGVSISRVYRLLHAGQSIEDALAESLTNRRTRGGRY